MIKAEMLCSCLYNKQKPRCDLRSPICISPSMPLSACSQKLRHITLFCDWLDEYHCHTHNGNRLGLFLTIHQKIGDGYTFYAAAAQRLHQSHNLNFPTKSFRSKRRILFSETIQCFSALLNAKSVDWVASLR